MIYKNIETIQRALGIIEGVMFGVKEPFSTGLATAVDMIDEAVSDECKTRGEELRCNRNEN